MPLVLVAVVLAAIVTDLVGLAAGLTAGIVLSLVGAALARQRTRARIDEAAAVLRQWRVGTSERRVTARPRGDWGVLAAAMDDLGRALDEVEGLLERERPWRRDLVGAIAGPALLFDLDGYLVAANAAAERLVGIPSQQPAPTAIQVTGSAELARLVGDAEPGAPLRELDVPLGERRVHAAVSVIGDEVLVTLEDLSEQARIDDLRRNFVVNASHELKTPATSIATLAEALELTVTRNPDRVPELVGRLREEAERLIHMVHDLLSLRRVEDEGVTAPERFDLAMLVRDVVAELLDSADQREVEVAVDAPDRVLVTGDPDDLRLVVRNLVTNAIQYNQPAGSVEIRLLDDPVRIVVEDDGIGIPQQDLGRVFERFYRVDVARSRETGGTGLGLSITRHAVERNGGTIDVTSLVGAGTTFTVTLPDLPAGTLPDLPAGTLPDLPPARR